MKFTEDEVKAIEHMLPAMGEYVAESGIGAKAFNDMTREEILGLFANTVRRFRYSLEDVVDGDIPF